ncbi:12774_t:CDS:2 [Funneliformis mosseae]|uniref:12774_t:CDS:1 n=1 Tax=Funneliformis mosseae TaxID=27381 RepID=A0A9N8V5S6_FUNMO|nr:12774_t:CDS:2 [Funneliformis mosseae]
MFDTDQTSLPQYRNQAPIYSRFISRRNYIIRLTLVGLLLGTTIWITLIKPLVESESSIILSDSANAEKQNTEPTQPMWQTDIKEVIDGRFSLFKKEQFTEVALNKNGMIPVTAVLLGWKRMESLQIVVNYISKYPFIKEILIWNNNNKMRIYAKDFILNNSEVTLNVFNSEKNLHDLSKYTTCSMAKYDYCYFQDYNWLNLYMDSLYTNFLNNPSLIHSNTMPINYLEHKRWMFANSDKNLHTGFTRLGCGSFASRAKVQRFLGQLGSISLMKDRLKFADVYFSLWTNQYPYQLSNPLITLDKKDGWKAGVNQWNVDQWNLFYNNILDATQKLYTALAVKSGSELFAPEEEQPYYNDRDARAPCLNDNCLFLTNIDPFPHPSRVYYANNITHVHDQEAKFNELDFPENSFWENHAYHHAVDLNERTCWNSFKIPKIGDYFGLQFVKPIFSEKITIVSTKDIRNFDASFNILVSLDGNEWLKCTGIHSDSIGYTFTRITLKFNCPDIAKTKQLFNYIRVEASRNFTEPLEICSLMLDGLSV